jgi:DNA polymerase I-like protein with 3'-5' exonuclease and polymerase domains
MIIRDQAGLDKAIELLNTQLEIAYDIETTGLNVRKDQMIGLSCAGEGFSFYIILKEYRNETLHELIPTSTLSPLFEILRSRRLITHNGSFDTRFTFHSTGVELWPSIFADTMLMAHTVDENRFNYGLKELGADIFGRDVTAEKEAMLSSIAANGGGKKEFYKADSTIIAEYGRKDAELTFNLFKHFKKQLHYSGLGKFFMTDEVMPLYREVTIPMELKGVPVDLELLTQTSSEITQDLERIESEIQTSLAPHLDLFNTWYLNKEYPVKLTGPFIQKYAELQGVELPRTKTGAFSMTAGNIAKLPDCRFKQLMTDGLRLTDSEILEVQKALFADSGQKYAFNIQSKDHLKRLFFTKLKETPLSRTDKGNPQVDDEFLDLMASKYEWAAKLRTYNRLSKINGTYVTRILEEQEDGIFYPSFAQHRTVSGRYGSDFQQLPRPLEEGQADPIIIKYNNRIRRFFVAGPGYKFVDDDYESLEPHVFAHVSGDPGLISIFERGHDFYSTIAIATEGLNDYSADKKADNYLGKKNKQARQNAKAYSLGIPYGMSGYKLAFELNIAQPEAEKLVANYLNAYPELKSWMIRSKKFAVENGFIKTEAGRLRRFPELKRLMAEHGEELLDSLALWKKYHETPSKYEHMKDLRRRCSNYLNNAMNVQIQGLASSIVNRACIAIARELKGTDAYIAAQIHDEIVVRCPEAMTERVCEIVQRNMETVYKLSLALKAPPSIGYNLAEAKG